MKASAQKCSDRRKLPLQGQRKQPEALEPPRHKAHATECFNRLRKTRSDNSIRGYLLLQVLPLLSERRLFLEQSQILAAALYFRPILNRTYSAEIPVLYSDSQATSIQGKRNLRLQRIIKQCRTLFLCPSGHIRTYPPAIVQRLLYYITGGITTIF